VYQYAFHTATLWYILMSMENVTRWQRRFEHFKSALSKLEEGVVRMDPVHGEADDALLVAGFIQTYSFTMELGWKTMKDYLFEKGHTLTGSREVMKQAFQDGLIEDGHVWMDAIDDRNLMAHVYDKGTSDTMVAKIRAQYVDMLQNLKSFFESKYDG
jgi:nucleotidyltransferase substrate binding protein (TIGR01987 family)